MTPTPRNPKSYNKTLDLSPEARSRLVGPVRANGYELLDGFRSLIGTIDYYGNNALDAELAAFIANAINELLTPAAPAVTIEPETTTALGQLVTNEIEAAEQPVRMCAVTDCLNAADPTSRGGEYCIACDVTGRAWGRWTAEEIIQREG